MLIHTRIRRKCNMIRYTFIVIFAILIATLLLCSLVSLRADKPISRAVSNICLSLVPPVLGNMLIIAATTRGLALVGCYIYYIGMDLIMYTLIRFTNEYCGGKNNDGVKMRPVPTWISCLLAADAIQILLNLVFGHAFELQEIEAYGKPYFLMNPLLGQSIHRIICYGAMATVIIVFIIRSIKVPSLYKERYIVILLSMIIGTLWQTYYIFSRTPIDRSMVGFGVFGILIFFFSIHYTHGT